MDLSKFGNHTSPSKFHPKFLTHPLQTLHDQTHIYGNTNSFSKYYAKSEEFRWLIRKVKQYSLRHDLSFRGYDTRLIPADVLRVMYIRYNVYIKLPDFYENLGFWPGSNSDRYFPNPNDLNIFSIPKLNNRGLSPTVR